MNLIVAEEGKEYIIQRIETDDEELDSFLFSLSRCYNWNISAMHHVCVED